MNSKLIYAATLALSLLGSVVVAGEQAVGPRAGTEPCSAATTCADFAAPGSAADRRATAQGFATRAKRAAASFSA